MEISLATYVLIATSVAKEFPVGLHKQKNCNFPMTSVWVKFQNFSFKRENNKQKEGKEGQ